VLEAVEALRPQVEMAARGVLVAVAEAVALALLAHRLVVAAVTAQFLSGLGKDL
jgi:hypothetical protein